MDVAANRIDEIIKICAAIARRQIGLFSFAPEITADDLAQAAMLRALPAADEYRQPYSFSSWVGRAANAAILDLRRIKERDHARRSVVMAVTPTIQQDSVEKKNEPCVADLAERLLCRARQIIPAVRRQGRWFEYSDPQIAAVLAIRRHMNQSYRGMVMMLESVPLRRALEIDTLPDHSALWQRARRLRGTPAALQPMMLLDYVNAG